MLGYSAILSQLNLFVYLKNNLKITFVHLHVGACVWLHTQRSKDSPQESAFLLHHVVPGMEVRPSGLEASTHWAILLTPQYSPSWTWSHGHLASASSVSLSYWNAPPQLVVLYIVHCSIFSIDDTKLKYWSTQKNTEDALHPAVSAIQSEFNSLYTQSPAVSLVCKFAF